MNRISKRMTILVAFVSMLCCAGLWHPSVSEAIVAAFDITETWDNGNVSFGVTNNAYSDIREFAVGNNDAHGAGVDAGASSAPDYLIEGGIAKKIDGYWKTDTSSGDRALTWMDIASNFGDYTSAFLFTSWGYEDTDYNGYLETSFTNGYRGTTNMPMSPFAAYSAGSGTIEGKTAVIPIPSAVWLLVSGMVGLVSLRKKLKK